MKNSFENSMNILVSLLAKHGLTNSRITVFSKWKLKHEWNQIEWNFEEEKQIKSIEVAPEKYALAVYAENELDAILNSPSYSEAELNILKYCEIKARVKEGDQFIFFVAENIHNENTVIIQSKINEKLILFFWKDRYDILPLSNLFENLNELIIHEKNHYRVIFINLLEDKEEMIKIIEQEKLEINYKNIEFYYLRDWNMPRSGAMLYGAGTSIGYPLIITNEKGQIVYKSDYWKSIVDIKSEIESVKENKGKIEKAEYKKLKNHFLYLKNNKTMLNKFAFPFEFEFQIKNKIWYDEKGKCIDKIYEKPIFQLHSKAKYQEVLEELAKICIIDSGLQSNCFQKKEIYYDDKQIHSNFKQFISKEFQDYQQRKLISNCYRIEKHMNWNYTYNKDKEVHCPSIPSTEYIIQVEVVKNPTETIINLKKKENEFKEKLIKENRNIRVDFLESFHPILKFSGIGMLDLKTETLIQIEGNNKNQIALHTGYFNIVICDLWFNIQKLNDFEKLFLKYENLFSQCVRLIYITSNFMKGQVIKLLKPFKYFEYFIVTEDWTQIFDERGMLLNFAYNMTSLFNKQGKLIFSGSANELNIIEWYLCTELSENKEKHLELDFKALSKQLFKIIDSNEFKMHIISQFSKIPIANESKLEIEIIKNIKFEDEKCAYLQPLLSVVYTHSNKDYLEIDNIISPFLALLPRKYIAIQEICIELIDLGYGIECHQCNKKLNEALYLPQYYCYYCKIWICDNCVDLFENHPHFLIFLLAKQNISIVKESLESQLTSDKLAGNCMLCDVENTIGISWKSLDQIVELCDSCFSEFLESIQQPTNNWIFNKMKSIYNNIGAKFNLDKMNFLRRVK